MADTFSVESGLIQYLSADTTIQSLTGGGNVFLEIAPPNVKTSVIVSRRFSDDIGVLSQPSTEIIEMMVKAVDESTSVATVNQIAKRVHELLENGVFTIGGYHLIACFRVQTVGPYVDTDGFVTTQHRPQIYEITVQPS